MLCWMATIFSSSRIIDQDLDECITIEDIDTHRTECAAWFLRLFFKRNDLPVGSCLQYTKPMPFFKRHNYGTKRDSSVVLLVEGNHWPIVHAVDMIACEDE